jgi:hypothetical protein
MEHQSNDKQFHFQLCDSAKTGNLEVFQKLYPKATKNNLDFAMYFLGKEVSKDRFSDTLAIAKMLIEQNPDIQFISSAYQNACYGQNQPLIEYLNNYLINNKDEQLSADCQRYRLSAAIMHNDQQVIASMPILDFHSFNQYEIAMAYSWALFHQNATIVHIIETSHAFTYDSIEIRMAIIRNDILQESMGYTKMELSELDKLPDKDVLGIFDNIFDNRHHDAIECHYPEFNICMRLFDYYENRFPNKAYPWKMYQYAISTQNKTQHLELVRFLEEKYSDEQLTLSLTDLVDQKNIPAIEARAKFISDTEFAYHLSRIDDVNLAKICLKYTSVLELYMFEQHTRTSPKEIANLIQLRLA